jgi:hypothetical protein
MTYSDKIKKADQVLAHMALLQDNEHFVVTYGKDYDGKPQRYRINCSIFREGKPSFSIYKDEVFGLNGMNIDKVGKTTLNAYTYDMMGQRTNYRFPLYKMEVVDTPYKEQSHTLKF